MDSKIYNGPNTIIDENNLPYIQESATYNSKSIETLLIDDNFIYIGGKDNLIKRHHLNNFTFIEQSINYTGNIHSIAADNDFLYIGGTTSVSALNRGVTRLFKNDITNVISPLNTVNFNGDINKILLYNNLLYAAGSGNNQVRLYNTSTMTQLFQSPNLGPAARDMFITDNKVYLAAGNDIYVLQESNLTLLNTFNSL
jgi:hypothetical protein